MALDKNDIAKRISQELKDGYYVNLGIGIPTLVANYIPEGMEVILQSENGLLGIGPFPTEDFTDAGETMADVGKEVGTTTGRGRRCGWFDAVAVKHASRLNGCDILSLMKIDVLDGFKTIKICVSLLKANSFHQF